MKIFHHSIPLFIGSLSVIGLLFFHDTSYTNYLDSLTPVSINIINSYSGTIERASGQNIVYSGNHLWTNQNNLTLTISATTGSNFTLNGDVNYLTGQGTGNYYIPKVITVATGDGIKTVQALFMRESEPYYSNALDIILDTTPPILSTILGPLNNSILSGIILFSRTDSNDLGIGLSHYNLHIALDPGFLGGITIPVSGNNLQVTSSLLPQGTLFWYIEVVDFLGNSITTSPTFFHNGQPSTIHGGSYSGGGGSYSGENNNYKSSGYNFITQINIHTGGILSGEIIKYKTGYYVDQNTGTSIGIQEHNNSIKDILLGKFTILTIQERGTISLPDPKKVDQQHNSAGIQPNALIYSNLLGLYYHNLHPLGNTMNIISRLLFPFYYIFKQLQYGVFNIREKILKKSRKIFDK